MQGSRIRVEPNEHQPAEGRETETRVENSGEQSAAQADNSVSVSAADGPPAGSVDAKPGKRRRSMTAAEYRAYLDRKIRRMYPWSVILFFAACASTWYVGGQTATGFNNTAGLTYSAAVMGILLAHELGHYLQALRYGVPASPPMFIPMPLPPLGTMGAVILQGAGFANRKVLFDIAISGPLAGLAVALPVAWWGLQNSSIMTIEPTQAAFIFGDPLILEWMYELRHGVLAPDQEVMLNPLLHAGWVGIFITAVNLVPVGQLDGGHILYTLLGRKAHWVAYGIVIGAVYWMIATENPTFMLMILLLCGFGLRHPPSSDDSAPIGSFRTILAWLTLAFVPIGFTPVPFMMMEPAAPAVAPENDSASTENAPSIIPMRPLIVPQEAG
jgi:Zn-dependent protease